MSLVHCPTNYIVQLVTGYAIHGVLSPLPTELGQCLYHIVSLPTMYPIQLSATTFNVQSRNMVKARVCIAFQSSLLACRYFSWSVNLTMAVAIEYVLDAFYIFV